MKFPAVALYTFVFGLLSLAPPLAGQGAGIFLAGKVLMEDGTAPPARAVLERVCGATRYPEGYTDEKGAFSFRLGQNAGTIPDASVAHQAAGARTAINTLGDTYTPVLSGCELRAVLAGYQSEPYNLSLVRGGDNVNVGTLILHPLAKAEGATVSATSLAAPKDAKKAFDKGSEAAKAKKWQDARKEFQKAVDAYPQYADAWFELGKTYEADGKEQEARKAYAQASAIDPKLLGPYQQLTALAIRKNDWKEVAANTAKVIELSPGEFPSAYFYNSMANYNLNDLDAAEKSARAGLKVDRQRTTPKLERMLGVVLANKQDYAGAAQALRSYLEHAPLAGDAAIVKKQLAQLEAALAGK
jgi:tetratricopeptide (TPR) repeat protein